MGARVGADDTLLSFTPASPSRCRAVVSNSPHPAPQLPAWRVCLPIPSLALVRSAVTLVFLTPPAHDDSLAASRNEHPGDPKGNFTLAKPAWLSATEKFQSGANPPIERAGSAGLTTWGHRRGSCGPPGSRQWASACSSFQEGLGHSEHQSTGRAWNLPEDGRWTEPWRASKDSSNTITATTTVLDS